jgi:hypothetical protein
VSAAFSYVMGGVRLEVREQRCFTAAGAVCSIIEMISKAPVMLGSRIMGSKGKFKLEKGQKNRLRVSYSLFLSSSL